MRFGICVSDSLPGFRLAAVGDDETEPSPQTHERVASTGLLTDAASISTLIRVAHHAPRNDDDDHELHAQAQG